MLRKIQKYHLSEDHTNKGVWWIIEKQAPNSGKCVYASPIEGDARIKLSELNSKSKLKCFLLNVIKFIQKFLKELFSLDRLFNGNPLHKYRKEKEVIFEGHVPIKDYFSKLTKSELYEMGKYNITIDFIHRTWDYLYDLEEVNSEYKDAIVDLLWFNLFSFLSPIYQSAYSNNKYCKAEDRDKWEHYSISNFEKALKIIEFNKEKFDLDKAKELFNSIINEKYFKNK